MLFAWSFWVQLVVFFCSGISEMLFQNLGVSWWGVGGGEAKYVVPVES